LQLHGFYAAKLGVHDEIEEMYRRNMSVGDRRDGAIARLSGGRRSRRQKKRVVHVAQSSKPSQEQQQQEEQNKRVRTDE